VLLPVILRREPRRQPSVQAGPCARQDRVTRSTKTRRTPVISAPVLISRSASSSSRRPCLASNSAKQTWPAATRVGPRKADRDRSLTGPRRTPSALLAGCYYRWLTRWPSNHGRRPDLMGSRAPWKSRLDAPQRSRWYVANICRCSLGSSRKREPHTESAAPMSFGSADRRRASGVTIRPARRFRVFVVRLGSPRGGPPTENLPMTHRMRGRRHHQVSIPRKPAGGVPPPVAKTTSLAARSRAVSSIVPLISVRRRRAGGSISGMPLYRRYRGAESVPTPRGIPSTARSCFPPDE